MLRGISLLLLLFLSFSKYLLSAYYVPSTVQRSECIMVNNIARPQGTYILLKDLDLREIIPQVDM